MRVSIILVTNKHRGFTIPVNGLLGQVEFKDHEARQVFDPELQRIVVKRDVPTYKKFSDFELIVVDTSEAGVNPEEVRSTARLSAGDDASRRGFLTTFGFSYYHHPGMSRWEAMCLAIGISTGDLVVFIPDLSYPGTNFLSAHVRAHAVPQVAISPMITRTYTRVLAEEDMDPLGALLDPYCTVTGEVPEETTDLNLMTPFTRVHSASFESDDVSRAILNSQYGVPGYELNIIACESGLPVKLMGGQEIALPRLDPSNVGANDGVIDSVAYQARVGCQAAEVVVTSSAPPVVRPWWKRVFS